MGRRRVLVTGVAGFIGSHVADDCLKEGFEVIGVDDLSGGFVDNVPAEVKFVKGDISDCEFVRNLFQDQKFDFVYHLAAYAAEGLSHFIRRFNYNNNLLGSINLINQSILNGVECFVFTSSIAVYGTNQVPMREEMTPRPEDPYGIAKYAIELDLATANHMFGLNYIIFRPHNVYGERQNIADKYRNVIGIFMNQVMQGQPMTIFGDGLQTRSFSHVSDVSAIIARSPLFENAYQKVFNIGADRARTVRDLAEVVARAMGVEPAIQYLPARKEVVHAVASHERVRDVFRPLAPMPLEEGIKRMAEWALKHGSRSPVEFGNIEVPLNMPPSWRKSS